MPRPEVLFNEDGRTIRDRLADWIDDFAEGRMDPVKIAIATAYFDPGGFRALASQLERAGGVRLLLGAEPVEPDPIRQLRLAATPEAAARKAREEAIAEHASKLALSRDLLGFTIEADRTAKRLVEWLRSGHVEVKRLTSQFLHGKAFLIETKDEGVVAGSANFTGAGLTRNVELALGQFQPGVVQEVSDWFQRWWDEAEPYDLAALYETRFLPHHPYMIFLRMLWELYYEELRQEADARGETEIHLTSFQQHGLLRARRILGERNGVLIADEVGLGKTFLAGELIRDAYILNRQRVLVIAPASLRDGNWRRFLSRHNLAVECRSFDEVARDFRLNPEHDVEVLDAAPNDYALVVIDEAHNARNPATRRADALRRLLAGSPPKKLVLLTATPVNNSLWDLYAILGYFVKNDAAFLENGIPSLREHFRAAQAMDPDDLSPEHLFDVLEAVAVRRTRPFVKRWYGDDAITLPDGTRLPIEFPTPRTHRVDYDLEAALPGFLERFADALDADPLVPEPGKITLARYIPSRYRVDGRREQYELLLTGLVRSNLLKRFESSAAAFVSTCRKMADSHNAFLSLLEAGYVATGEPLAEWAASDSEETEEVLERLGDDLEPALLFDVERLRADVEADRDLLLSFADEADQLDIEADPKLDELVRQLEAIAEEAETKLVGQRAVDGRKVLVFSYFADTVEWIERRLERELVRNSRLAAYVDRTATVSGRAGEKEEVIFGFAPVSSEAPEGRDEDRFDLLVATDVLSEGVNLQQARHIVNYDLPWNPMRLVQRHGRIDRIGSQWTEIHLRCFFPDKQLDSLLDLEARLHRKIAQAAATIGVASVILPGARTEETVYAERREEIERLREGDATLFTEGPQARSASLSGEEFRRELQDVIEKQREVADLARALPYGAGSGFVGPVQEETFVFCFRVADDPKARFCAVQGERVRLGDADNATLACLVAARPPDGADQERVLDDWAMERAVAAWELASERIVEDWNWRADPANIRPRTPRAMELAIDIVQRGPLPAGMGREASDELVERLRAPYAERYLRRFRAIINDEGLTDPEKIAGFVELADELSLETPTPLPDLPEIEHADLRVVCWTCVTPEERA